MAYQCSLIINAYNQAEELRLVLDSVAGQSVSDFEVIIADDGSTDHTSEVVAKFQDEHPNIPIQHVWHEDSGFQRTVILNKAVGYSRAQYLIFIDSDLILHPRFIEGHLHCRDSYKVLSGGRGVKLNERFVARLKEGEDKMRFGMLNLIKRRLRGDLRHCFRGSVIKNRLLRKMVIPQKGRLTGCNFSMYKPAWESVNGMDATIREYGFEDYELGCRLQRAGYMLESVCFCANTFHMEHPKHELPFGKEITA